MKPIDQATLNDLTQRLHKTADDIAVQGKLWAELANALASAWAELQAYRQGGVTEEILRRNDGCIKVGRGCVIVLESDWNRLATPTRHSPLAPCHS